MRFVFFAGFGLLFQSLVLASTSVSFFSSCETTLTNGFNPAPSFAVQEIQNLGGNDYEATYTIGILGCQPSSLILVTPFLPVGLTVNLDSCLISGTLSFLVPEGIEIFCLPPIALSVDFCLSPSIRSLVACSEEGSIESSLQYSFACGENTLGYCFYIKDSGIISEPGTTPSPWISPPGNYPSSSPQISPGTTPTSYFYPIDWTLSSPEGPTDVSPTPGGDTSPALGGDTSPTPGGDTSPTPGGDTSPAPGGSTSPTPGGDTSPTPGGGTSPTPGGGTSPTPGGDTSPSSSSRTTTPVAPPSVLTQTVVSSIDTVVAVTTNGAITSVLTRVPVTTTVRSTSGGTAAQTSTTATAPAQAPGIRASLQVLFAAMGVLAFV